MSEQIKKITRETLIPIGIVAGVISVVAWGAWCIAKIDVRSINNETNIITISNKIDGIPSRNEFENLKEYFNQRFTTLEDLLKKND